MASAIAPSITSMASVRAAGRLLAGEELRVAMQHLSWAMAEARLSPCARDRCGAALVSESGCVIGSGFNSPPAGTAPRCGRKAEIRPGFKSDRTCCMHAEQRAIMAAVRYMAVGGVGGQFGSYRPRVYFVRLTPGGDEIAPSGDPYCTLCSKFALDCGVAEWCLLHPEGVRVYPAAAYNEISFAYGQET